MAGKLSTHVLDTAQGQPAAGMAIELWRCNGDEAAKLLKRVETKEDGRTGGPILSGDDFLAGTFELRFQVGAYFRKTILASADPAFLEEVPVRFTVADARASYHIPLLVSPWAYSTYRGS